MHTHILYIRAGIFSDGAEHCGEHEADGEDVAVVAHATAEHLEEADLAFLDGDFGHSERGGDVGVFHSLLEAHAEELTVVVGEVADGGMEGVEGLMLDERAGGVGLMALGGAVGIGIVAHGREFAEG